MAKRYGPYRYEFELGKRNYNLTAQVEAIVQKTEKRMLALVRQSVQETIDIAQTPTGKGGKMRVDTGFLRASGQMSFNGMPTGPIRPTKEEIKADKKFPSAEKYSSTASVLQLGNLKIGMTIFFGWTANYAKYREAYDGFLYGAVERWQQTVNEVTEQIKKRIP